MLINKNRNNRNSLWWTLYPSFFFYITKNTTFNKTQWQLTSVLCLHSDIMWYFNQNFAKHSDVVSMTPDTTPPPRRRSESPHLDHSFLRCSVSLFMKYLCFLKMFIETICVFNLIPVDLEGSGYIHWGCKPRGGNVAQMSLGSGIMSRLHLIFLKQITTFDRHTAAESK